MTKGLELPQIDTVIVTLPDVSDDVTLEYLEPVWLALEEAVRNGSVAYIGLADVSSRLFMELFEWAKVSLCSLNHLMHLCLCVCLEYLELVWLALEEAVRNGTIACIGLSDVSSCLFMELFEWAKVSFCFVSHLT